MARGCVSRVACRALYTCCRSHGPRSRILSSLSCAWSRSSGRASGVCMPICTVLLCWRLGTNSSVVSLTLYRHVRAAPGSADAPADTADTGGCGSAAAATPRDATRRANRAAISLRQVIANIASGPLRALGLYSAVMRVEHGHGIGGGKPGRPRPASLCDGTWTSQARASSATPAVRDGTSGSCGRFARFIRPFVAGLGRHRNGVPWSTRVP